MIWIAFWNGALGCAAAAALAVVPPASHAPPPTVSVTSLLKEMVNREAVARLPVPRYTAHQASSYDRASTSPNDERGWFANDDHGHFVRAERVAAEDGGPGRLENVMLDASSPGGGAVVRIWSANPAGILRVYIDGAAKPVIEAPMEDVLGGRWAVGPVTIGPPLAGMRARGWNLFLPIPFARSCRITTDAPDLYYHVNYRAYAAGTPVTPFDAAELARAADTLRITQSELGGAPRQSTYDKHDYVDIPAGQSHPFLLSRGRSPGPGAVTGLQIDLADLTSKDVTQALRSTVVRLEFDDRETVWCPMGDFFGCGVGKNEFRTWYTGISGSRLPACRWVMPYQRTARLVLENTGATPVRVQVYSRVGDWTWDDRSMYFHARWRHQHPVQVYGGRGTRDFNFVEIQGRGVYVGDALAVMNPVREWWGEGDEKIYVDGEAFPSHFGTGTEDYYGFAWCSPEPFSHPFHAQPRSDGHAEQTNRGHATVVRVRSLDAIPFERSLKMDMELWHWKECSVALAATTYFYARPGATTNAPPIPAEAARAVPHPPPLPPPFKVTGAVECEDATIAARAPDLKVTAQDMRAMGSGRWSGEKHLWVQGREPGDFVELAIPVRDARPVALTVHATRSWDYGIVRFSVNGVPAGGDVDLFSGEPGKCTPAAPIPLGTFTPKDGALRLRVEVVGSNPAAVGSRSMFGLDCVVLTPAP